MSQKEAPKSINVYVNEENKATICCPYCGYTATVSAEKFSTDKKILKKPMHVQEKVSFAPWNSASIIVKGPTRRFDAQPENSKGYRYRRSGYFRRGIGFTILSQNAPEVGDVLDLDFTLDNANRSKISVQVSVRTVEERFIGSQFVIRNLPRELGFYLMK